MKPVSLLYRITGVVLLIQLLLGGLLTFNFIAPAAHIVTGIILFILVIATTIFAFISKPAFKPVQWMSVVLVILIVVQIILGFDTLDNGNQFIAWLHFVNAMFIYGLVISATFMTSMHDRMIGMHSGPSAGSG